MVGKIGYPFSKENTVNMRINGELEIKIYRKIMKIVVAHNQFLTNHTYSFSLLLFLKNQSCSASLFVSTGNAKTKGQNLRFCKLCGLMTHNNTVLIGSTIQQNPDVLQCKPRISTVCSELENTLNEKLH